LRDPASARLPPALKKRPALFQPVIIPTGSMPCGDLPRSQREALWYWGGSHGHTWRE